MLKVYKLGKLKEGFLFIFLYLYYKNLNNLGSYYTLNKLNNKPSIPLSKGFILLVILYALASSQPLFSQTLPPGFTDTGVSAQWNEAVGLTFNKTGNQMFVWERTGRVFVVENNQKQVLIDLREEVAGYWDMGLLGFALHPQFETNGYFYLLYNVDRHHLLHYGTGNYNQFANEFYVASIGRLTRYTATKTSTGYTVNPATRKVLIGATKNTGIPTTHISHGVGSLVFGTDGTLLVSTGDGAGANPNVGDTGNSPDTYYSQALADGIITEEENVGAFRSQILESYNGKILRIDPETGNGISSNPFYESANPGSVRSKVWALGLRNPFRMSLKPNSGSSNPAAADPGALYVGDVGYVTWEELNIINKPGLNLGWPLYEGLSPHEAFWNKKTYNKYAPNPLYGINGCTQQYFYFQDLIKQATHSGNASFTNPCNPTEPIPAAVQTFLHSRPVIDWKHEQALTRTATFSGETATITNLGAPGSPVSGTPFSGSSVTAGVFYPHDDFPPEYQNTFFFGDYVGGWVRSLAVDNENNPTAIKSLISNNAIVVGMATHPTEPGLYYISFTSQIRKITYNKTNLPPVAVASADKTYGPSPLNIQFTGSASQDPEGQPLTCRWDFGDGTSSTLPNPTHSFTTVTNDPAQRTVTLTVTDSQGSSHQTSLIISVNNTPPQVEITGPLDNTYYPMTGQTTYDLRANVTDSEHSSSQLSYKWQTTLHHASHEHPEPPVTSPETTAVISPLGCGAETYFYSITLTVTDAAGLATTKVVRLYPQCSSPPTVSITSPAANASYPAPASLIIAANAADGDGSVSKVEFFQGTTKLGEDLTAPYTLTWSNVVAGAYSLTAKATDNTDQVTTSAAVNITVNAPVPPPVPPTVSITAPTTGTSFMAPATISITANATDADGTINIVEFFNGTTKLGEDATAPYSYSWTGVEAGSYSLTAKATDNTGQVTTSAPVSISINAPVPPTVALTSPGANASYTAPATVALAASAVDADGTIAKVEFFQGTTKLGEVLTTPYVYSWTGVAAGGYSLTAKATDNSGLVTTSAAVNITVNTPVPPTVSITAPTTGTSFMAPATISITANATDADGTINIVEFFNGTTKLGEDATAPYSYSWSNVPSGNYNLTAKATDNIGATTNSAVVAITVKAPVAPTVSITSPAANASYTAPASLIIAANAADGDGSVSKVEFFQGTTRLGEDVTAPFSYSWSNVAAGNYSLTTKATDNTGLVTTSAAVSITVNESVPVALTMALTSTVTQAEPWYGMFGPFEGAGSIDLNVSGGTPPYTYRWNSGTGTQDIPAASPGMYSVNVADANGSQAQTTLYVGRKNSPMTLASAHINSSGATNRDGSINLSVIGGVLPYTYRWSNGGTTEDVIGLLPGSYTVDVMDAFGRVVTTWVTVSPPGTALGLVIAHKNITKAGSDDGFIDLTVKGGVGPFTYWWNSRTISQDLTRVTAGLYQVQVTDATGNTAFASVRVLAPGQLPSAKSPGIDEIFQEAEPDFVIYPNPTNVRSFVKFKLPSGGKYTLELYDSKGAKVKTIATGHTQIKKSQTLEINLANHAQGVYLLKLITEKGITSKPLIIQP